MKKNICDLCDLEVTKDDEDNGNATCTGKIVYGYDIVSPTHVDCPEVEENK